MPFDSHAVSPWTLLGSRQALRMMVLGLAAWLAQPAGAASNIVSTPRTEARILAEVSTIAPRRPFWVGLKLKLQPGWHTYWRNPGDAGLAAAIEWDLPQGFVAGQIRWPRPERFRLGSSVTFGYEKEAILLTRISPAPGADLGEPITLKARARWMVCTDVCIPEEGEFSMSFGRADSAPGLATEAATSLATAAAKLPNQVADGASIRTSPTEIRLTVPLAIQELPASAWFYPFEYGVLDYGAPQPLRRVDEGIELKLTRGELRGSPLDRLQGVLVIGEQDDQRFSWLIDAAPN